MQNLVFNEEGSGETAAEGVDLQEGDTSPGGEVATASRMQNLVFNEEGSGSSSSSSRKKKKLAVEAVTGHRKCKAVRVVPVYYEFWLDYNHLVDIFVAKNVEEFRNWYMYWDEGSNQLISIYPSYQNDVLEVISLCNFFKREVLILRKDSGCINLACFQELLAKFDVQGFAVDNIFGVYIHDVSRYYNDSMQNEVDLEEFASYTLRLKWPEDKNSHEYLATCAYAVGILADRRMQWTSESVEAKQVGDKRVHVGDEQDRYSDKRSKRSLESVSVTSPKSMSFS